LSYGFSGAVIESTPGSCPASKEIELSQPQSTAQEGAPPDRIDPSADIAARIDRIPVGRFHVRLASMLGVGTFFDGFEYLGRRSRGRVGVLYQSAFSWGLLFAPVIALALSSGASRRPPPMRTSTSPSLPGASTAGGR
jgi:hypothetical protein